MSNWKQEHHWQVVNAGNQVVSNTPKQLWEAAASYFDWCDCNPIKSKRTHTSGKMSGTQYEVESVRPYTIKAFCLHANISERYINDIKETHAKDSEWFMVMEKILYIIYNQIVEQALIDNFNPIMASKLLGMDKESGESEKAPKVEIVDSVKDKLANSENEVLKKLDFGKLVLINDKAENSQRENHER